MENEVPQQVVETPAPPAKTFNELSAERRKPATGSVTPQGDKQPDASGQPGKTGSESGSPSEGGITQERPKGEQPRRDDFTARAKQLAAEKKAAEERAEAAEQKLQGYEQRLKALESRPASTPEPPKAEPKPADGDKKPKPKWKEFLANSANDPKLKDLDYESIREAFDEETDAWRDRQAATKAQEGKELTEQQAFQQKVLGAIDDAKKKHPDFNTVGANVSIGLSAENHLAFVGNFDVEGVKATDVLQYLGKHPEELERVQKASGQPKLTELTRIALKLATPHSPEKPKSQPLTNTPAPHTPLKGAVAPPEETGRAAQTFNELANERRAAAKRATR